MSVSDRRTPEGIDNMILRRRARERARCATATYHQRTFRALLAIEKAKLGNPGARTTEYRRARMRAVRAVCEAHPDTFQRLYQIELEADGFEPLPVGRPKAS